MAAARPLLRILHDLPVSSMGSASTFAARSTSGRSEIKIPLPQRAQIGETRDFADLRYPATNGSNVLINDPRTLPAYPVKHFVCAHFKTCHLLGSHPMHTVFWCRLQRKPLELRINFHVLIIAQISPNTCDRHTSEEFSNSNQNSSGMADRFHWKICFNSSGDFGPGMTDFTTPVRNGN